MKPDLPAAEAAFRENFALRGELGASLSVWWQGQEVLSLGEGYHDRQQQTVWTPETSVLVWSATKGPAAACLLHALARHGESLHTPVAAVWPEFLHGGKEGVTFGELLSHQAGLAALDEEAPITDHALAAAALAAQTPNWRLGEGHGYHPRTFGFLLDEAVRRLEGEPLGAYWRRWFGVPLGLEFWIGGVPEGVSISPVHAARLKAGAEPSPEDIPFQKAMADATSLTARAFRSPAGLQGVAAMNNPAQRQASLPSFGGIGTARALGKFYAMLAEGGALDGVRLFEDTAVMSRPLTNGPDRVLLRDTAFAAGFMQDPVDASGRKTRQLFGPSLAAFGQPGAGGSHAFADPEHRLAFVYVMNQMEAGVLPNERALGIVRALYGL